MDKNILISYSGYVASKMVNALYFIINKIKGYIQEHNGNKYVTLAQADERKDTLKKVWRTMEGNQRSN